MNISRIDHFTLRVAPAALPGLLDFYSRVLGLREGDRPDFAFPGHWLYASDKAVVHLAGNAPAGEETPSKTLPTGRFNHVALSASGLAATREHLAAHDVKWAEAPVPGFPLHQIFLQDPLGLKIELTFDAAELETAGPMARPAAR